MHRWIPIAGGTLLTLGLLLAPQAAQAQVYVRVGSPPPIVIPTTAYYLPPPFVSYSPAVAYYSAPVVTYSHPVTVYSAPVFQPSVVTTRTYVGYGIFRPRGVYTDTYLTPVAPRTTYYVPVYVR